MDQRYFYRSDAICDIGAYEADSLLAQSGTLAFSASDYSVNEIDGAATITFTRTGGSEGVVSVPYFDSELGTAITSGSGSDYIGFIATRLEWADGDSSDKTLEITVNDDTLIEDDETILLQLKSDVHVYGGASLGISAATVTIKDDETDDSGSDGTGELQFENISTIVNETDGTATVTVTRTNGSEGTVTIDYVSSLEFITEPATNGSDYDLTAGTLTFADGVTSQTITFSIIDDLIVEGDEEFWIDLENPAGGASLGADWFMRVTITDDETEPDGSDGTDDGSDTDGGTEPDGNDGSDGDSSEESSDGGGGSMNPYYHTNNSP